MIAPVSNFMGGMLTFHYIAAAHIIGGVMIVCGLLTRWALKPQLPILIGAVLLNFIGDINSINVIISLATLAASIFYTVYGSEKNSADYYFKMEK